ncbi:MAG TPA: hypothetical protein VKE30_03755 [Chthoniobacterales bacterium]|nr:hypothetical protein [Chthoniobacterales bacterium]
MNLKIKASRGNSARSRRGRLGRRLQNHDPFLVLNMSIFNFAGGWDRLLNRRGVYTNGT